MQLCSIAAGVVPEKTVAFSAIFTCLLIAAIPFRLSSGIALTLIVFKEKLINAVLVSIQIDIDARSV